LMSPLNKGSGEANEGASLKYRVLDPPGSSLGPLGVDTE
jgi:hypothetical protein